MSNMPNVPMTHPITTCRHKTDRKKYNEGWERVFGKKKLMEDIETLARDMEIRGKELITEKK